MTKNLVPISPCLITLFPFWNFVSFKAFARLSSCASARLRKMYTFLSAAFLEEKSRAPSTARAASSPAAPPKIRITADVVSNATFECPFETRACWKGFFGSFTYSSPKLCPLRRLVACPEGDFTETSPSTTITKRTAEPSFCVLFSTTASPSMNSRTSIDPATVASLSFSKCAKKAFVWSAINFMFPKRTDCRSPNTCERRSLPIQLHTASPFAVTVAERGSS
mmetsp:Transcript_19921/g.40044  ORF Transcript_19921/g.40044 Transcript_19921/m.40044 type:complete len:223 (+) Transcript_19921:1666-2334(+)